MDYMHSTTRIEDLVAALRIIQENYGNIIVAGIVKNESNRSYIEPRVEVLTIHDEEGHGQDIVSVSFN